MVTTKPSEADVRVVICAPVGRDASLAQQTLNKADIHADIVADVDALCREIEIGAGVLLVTQEALVPAALERLLATLNVQLSWSDLPIVALISRGPSTPANAMLAAHLAPRASVTFLERPVSTTTLVSATRAALWARQRQYEVRDLLLARLQAEEAERRARAAAEQAVQIRDQFLASVAHDLKNPLGAIKGYAQLLRRQAVKANGLGTERLVQGLDRIDTMVTRAVGQIDELLDVARLRASQALELNTAPTDLVALAHLVVEEFQQASSWHRIRIETAVDEILGVWDAARLERVIENLLANATKYSEPDSEIVIRVALSESASESWATLSVRDRGIGIPPKDLPRLFEPFYRASNAVGQKPGTGLGLAGARHIVEQHGGVIEVESVEGHGSTFTVRLPVVPVGHSTTRP
jgi:signal transduction histidine kinase